MSGEIYLILSAVLGAGFFALGGTEIPAFGRGYKWIRRELLPICWGVLAYYAGFHLWQCIGMAVMFDIWFRLPYGDRTPVWLKSVVFCTMPLPSLFLGFNEWQAFSGALCFFMWVLSNFKPTAKIFDWATSCLLIGAFLGITVGKLILQTY